MKLPMVVPTMAAARHYVGADLGTTEWLQIDQARIDRFADATNDRQWIYCDVERAGRESPWKSTVAHGYLLLALAPTLLKKLMVLVGWKTAINTGVEKLRFPAPAPAGSRVRMAGRIANARDPAGRWVPRRVRRRVRGRGQRGARLHRHRELRLLPLTRPDPPVLCV